VGSNIFNILSVMGLSATVAPAGLPVDPGLLRFDMPIMLAIAIACLPIFFTGYTIARWEGLVFLGFYVAYTLYLILNESGHVALPAFSTAMLWFVLPLTALTLAVTVFREVRSRQQRATA